jgi:hypothetical protein
MTEIVYSPLVGSAASGIDGVLKSVSRASSSPSGPSRSSVVSRLVADSRPMSTISPARPRNVTASWYPRRAAENGSFRSIRLVAVSPSEIESRSPSCWVRSSLWTRESRYGDGVCEPLVEAMTVYVPSVGRRTSVSAAVDAVLELSSLARV